MTAAAAAPAAAGAPSIVARPDGWALTVDGGYAVVEHGLCDGRHGWQWRSSRPGFSAGGWSLHRTEALVHAAGALTGEAWAVEWGECSECDRPDAPDRGCERCGDHGEIPVLVEPQGDADARDS